MRPRRLAVLLALALAACGSSPKTRFFALDAVPASHSQAGAAGRSIDVAVVKLPAVLDRLELVRRIAPNQVDVSDRDRWAAPLDDMTRRVIAEDLASRLPRATIAAAEPKQDAATEALVVTFDRFETDASGQTILDADWSLLGGGPRRRTVARGREHIVVAGKEGGGAGQAAAMSEALGQLADRIAARLATAG